MSAAPAQAPSLVQRLLGYLEQDPENLQLLGDAAATAFDARDPETARAVLERYAKLAPLPPALLNLRGLVAMNQDRFEDAGADFRALMDAEQDDPRLRFNLAWCLAVGGDQEAVLALLDDAVIAAVPRAAALKVQALHHLGRMEEALALAPELTALYPDDPALMSALAVAALDEERPALAAEFASKAGDTPDALSTLGMLDLSGSEVDQALGRFERALQASPDDARSNLGRGLGLMAKGDLGAAAHSLDRGAEGFGDHLGSWIAAGWAYFVKGDVATARARFELALALDDTFAETHGALAVLDVMAGDLASAERRTEVALRLDRQCFSAALAKSLMLASAGDTQKAERIREMALNSPIGPNGQTLAQAMVALSAGVGRPRGA